MKGEKEVQDEIIGAHLHCSYGDDPARQKSDKKQSDKY